jgi:hypothetical protein
MAMTATADAVAAAGVAAAVTAAPVRKAVVPRKRVTAVTAPLPKTAMATATVTVVITMTSPVTTAHHARPHNRKTARRWLLPQTAPKAAGVTNLPARAGGNA